VLIAVIGWRLQDFLDLGMSTSDQLDFSTDLVGRGVWQATLDYAREQGRLHFLLTKPVDLLAATYATSAMVQIANIALFAGVPCLLAWLVFGDRDDQSIFLLVYWTLCAAGWHHTTPAAYPIVPALPFAFAATAAVVAQSHSGSPHWLKLLAFALLAFAAFFQYEPATLITLMLLLWFVHTRVPAAAGRTSLFIATTASIGIYAVAYMVWRYMFPTGYEGSVGGALSPVAIARVLAAYSLGALPVSHFLGHMPPVVVGDAMLGRLAVPYPGIDAAALLHGIEWMDVIVSVAAGLLLWVLLSARLGQDEGRRRSGAAPPWQEFCLGLLILLFSNLLLALTRKYQLWAEGGSSAYLTSYFALFGWVVLITSLCRLISRRSVVNGVVLAFIAVFLGSAAYNHATARQIRANFSKWQAVAALAACRDRLGAYQSFVLPAAFEAVFQRASNWSLYWREWTATSFGSAMHIAPAAGAGVDSPAFVQAIRNDGGKLTAVLGHGASTGFLIYRNERPNYLWLRQQPGAGADSDGELVVVGDRGTSRCHDGYRMIEFAASRPIDSIAIGRHLPDVIPASRDDPALYVVADADVEDAVQALYLGFFERAADAGGLQFWAGRVRRSGNTVRDVAELFAATYERGLEPRDRDFRGRLARSYLKLVGRPPRADELQRLDRFEGRPELLAVVPWLVIADLLAARDVGFRNRLELARHYTQNVFSTQGWRAELWDRAVPLVDETPESVQRAIASLGG
jgi:hypothetical protein